MLIQRLGRDASESQARSEDMVEVVPDEDSPMSSLTQPFTV